MYESVKSGIKRKRERERAQKANNPVLQSLQCNQLKGQLTGDQLRQDVEELVLTWVFISTMVSLC